MDEQLEFLKLIAERLESACIPYMATGSMAMAFYGTPRMTRDVDIVVDAQPDETEAIYRLFKNDCFIDRGSVAKALSRRGMFNIIHCDWLIKADFIVRKDEPYRRLEFGRRRKMEIGGGNLFVVAPEDLILTKLCWGKPSLSELQIRDAALLAKTRPDLDWDYLKDWARKLDVADLLKRTHEDE